MRLTVRFVGYFVVVIYAPFLWRNQMIQLDRIPNVKNMATVDIEQAASRHKTTFLSNILNGVKSSRLRFSRYFFVNNQQVFPFLSDVECGAAASRQHDDQKNTENSHYLNI